MVGVVSVEATSFKEFCLSYPTNILSELDYEFPKLVAKKAEELVTDIKVTPKLSWPNNVQSCNSVCDQGVGWYPGCGVVSRVWVVSGTYYVCGVCMW